MRTLDEATSRSEDRDIVSVYREVRNTLIGFLRQQTGDAQAAEDILHDVILKVLANEASGRPAPDNLGAWLYTVARNAAIDWHRSRRPSEELPLDLAAPMDEDDDTGLGLAQCLRPLADRLPATYRDTLIAAEFDGQAFRQVAQAQGISVAAAKTRASRGRKLLQRELVQCCRVVLSEDGQVLDYDADATASCAPGRGGCGTLTGESCDS
jgi:RNA polymerase sigma-70 factor, ECF subfamily